jgi:hypothetical protein
MEYAEGGNLKQIIDEFGCLSVPYARFLTAELVLALAFLHSNGVIHRSVCKSDSLSLYNYVFTKYLGWLFTPSVLYILYLLERTIHFDFTLQEFVFQILILFFVYFI